METVCKSVKKLIDVLATRAFLAILNVIHNIADIGKALIKTVVMTPQYQKH